MNKSVKVSELPPFDARSFLDSGDALFTDLRRTLKARAPGLLAAALRDVVVRVQDWSMANQDAAEDDSKAAGL